MATASSAPAPAASHPDGELTHRQIVTIILGLMTGMFLAALDQNIVGTAIRTISDDLKGLDVQAWVTTAYLITSTISTPIYGKLSDIYGRKKFFLAAIIIFVIGSLACSFATSMYMLAAFRAIQGLGAGGLMSLALAIIGDIVPPRERAKYQGYFLAVFGTSSVLGPVIGGFFAGSDEILGMTGWRWVFLINVPLGILALFAVSATLHLHHVPRKARIDWAGAFTLVLGLVPLLTVAEQGREWGWTSTKSLTAFAVGVVGILAFVWAEHRAGDDALIPLRIFRNRAIVIALTGGFVVGAGMFGAMMTLPQFYLQIINGSSPTKAGLQMLPMVLGMMIFSIVSGQLMSKTGRIKAFPVVGVAIMTVVLVLLTRLHGDTPLWQVLTLMFFFGAGLGNVMQPLTLAVQAAVEPREIGMATSSATFFRQMGGTLGVAIFLSVMFNQLPGKITDALKDASSTTDFQSALRDPSVLANKDNLAFATALKEHSGSFLAGIQQDSSVIQRLDPRLAAPIKEGFAQSMDMIFWLGAIACAIGFVVLLFLPNFTLSSRSARAAAADAEREPTGPLDPLAHDASDEDRRLHAGLEKFLLDAAAIEAGGHTFDELQDTWDHLEQSGRSRHGGAHGPQGPGMDVEAGAPAAAAAPVVGAAYDRTDHHPGHVPAAEGGHERPAGTEPARSESRTALLSPSVDLHEEVTLERTGSGNQRYWHAFDGVVRRADGEPVQAQVTVTDVAGLALARTTSDRAGRYRLEVPSSAVPRRLTIEVEAVRGEDVLDR